MDRMTHLGLGLYQGQIEDLRQEAATAGNEAMIRICDDALECDRTALAECARVIAEAEAQQRSRSRTIDLKPKKRRKRAKKRRKRAK